MSFSIFLDSTANLPLSLIPGEDIHIIPFNYFVEGEEKANIDIDTFDGPAFYDAMIAGTKVTTSQINPTVYEEYFRAVLEEGKDLIYLAMSSGISGAYQSSVIAANELHEEFPERKIYCLDTKSASLADGYFVIWALECRNKGMNLEDTYSLLESHVKNMVQVFTVDNLEYLRRGGRISNFTAAMATVLNIKPLLKGNENGQIVNFGTVRGRKKSIRAIADRYDEFVVDHENAIAYIAHANCPEDAELLCQYLNEKKPPKQIISVMYEPVTGSHVGPGALALFFMGTDDNRIKMK